MKKILWIFALLPVLTGCKKENVDSKSASTEVIGKETMLVQTCSGPVAISLTLNATWWLAPTGNRPGYLQLYAYPNPADYGLVVYGKVISNTGTTFELECAASYSDMVSANTFWETFHLCSSKTYQGNQLVDQRLYCPYPGSCPGTTGGTNPGTSGCPCPYPTTCPNCNCGDPNCQCYHDTIVFNTLPPYFKTPIKFHDDVEEYLKTVS